MKSKLLVYFLPVILTVFLIYGYGINDNPFIALSDTKEYKSLNLDGNPIVMTTAGDSCHGTGQEKHDDGSMENGLGYNETVADAHIVSKFRPSSYPWKYTKFCVGITKSPAAAPDSLIFSVVIFDSTGPGGQPGNILGTLPNQVAKPIPTFSAFQWFSFDISNVTGNIVNDGAIYIGVRYDAQPLNQRSKFLSFDTSPTTPLWPGYAKSAAANPWTRVDSLGATFATFRCLAMRTMGETFTPGVCLFAGQWAPTGTYPVVPGGTYFGASAWLGDTLYAQNPTATGTAATQVVRYTWNGTWTTGVSLPGPKTGLALVEAGGKLYGIGGSTSSISLTPSNEVISYDPATGTWTTMAPMPVAMSGHSAVVWGDSVIFVVGGPWANSGTNLAVHYYRIASNTWGTISNSLPAGQGRRSFGLGIVGNKIIMSAGFNTAFLKNTYVGTIGSDATSITWAAAPVVPVPAFFTGLSRPGATTYGDLFFLVNGERGGPGGYHDTTHVFSVSLNQWVGMITNIPFKRSNIFNNVTARCIEDTVSIFVPGGYGTITGTGAGAGTNLFDVTRVGILTGITQVSTEIPGTYELSQNYPNPFNPATKINFSIPKSGLVTLKVYDILGKEVATLVNEIRNAGLHSVEFNASYLASGAYFYRIEAGDFRAVKKMMLLK